MAGVCRTLASALVLGYTVTLLGNEWVESRGGVVPQWRLEEELQRAQGSLTARLVHDDQTVKVLAYTDWLRENVGARGSGEAKGDEIVLLIDAYDVVFQLPPPALLSGLSDLNVTHPIMAAAEKSCFPVAESEASLCENAPTSPWQEEYSNLRCTPKGLQEPEFPHFAWDVCDKTAPRWLNSGVLAGRAHDLLNLLGSFTEEEVAKNNDQRLVLMKYLTRSGGIQIDFGSRVVHCAYHAVQELEPVPTDGSFLFRNNMTGQTPVLFHFNGYTKKFGECMWEGVYGGRLRRGQRLEGRLEDGAGAEIDFWEFCGEHLDNAGAI